MNEFHRHDLHESLPPTLLRTRFRKCLPLAVSKTDAKRNLGKAVSRTKLPANESHRKVPRSRRFAEHSPFQRFSPSQTLLFHAFGCLNGLHAKSKSVAV